MVEQALRLGYRHIDTAEMYGNEPRWGRGCAPPASSATRCSSPRRCGRRISPRASLRGPPRKAWCKLRLSEVDLLLLHWPNPNIPLAETLGALCKVKKAGLARHIGVSNFTVALVDEAVRLASEPIVCNQIEVHPFLDQSKVIAACRAQGIAVVAYSPIARGGVKNNKLLARIGKAHGKTAAQVCLRYLVQQDIVVIPRTSKVERLMENFAIFDFELSPDEMKEIAGLAHRDGRVVDFSFSGSPNWD